MEFSIPIQVIVSAPQGAKGIANTKKRKIQLNGTNPPAPNPAPGPVPNPTTTPAIQLQKRDLRTTFSQVDRGPRRRRGDVVGDMTDELLENFMAERHAQRLGDKPGVLRRMWAGTQSALTDHWTRQRAKRRIRREVIGQKSNTSGHQQLALEEQWSNIAERHADQGASLTHVADITRTDYPEIHKQLNKIAQEYYTQ